ESWVITEGRRLIPEIFQWSAVLSVCLGWPGAVYFFSKA
nr:Chain m, Cytochrome c oxidase subunit 26, mitochondrial [Saccharomyces cerevisiae S288C]6YMY_m Chain m, Cytochrome c oxidase subunit 26, mitochondrial [Saccharomyces cerevisiae S288C]